MFKWKRSDKSSLDGGLCPFYRFAWGFLVSGTDVGNEEEGETRYKMRMERCSNGEMGRGIKERILFYLPFHLCVSDVWEVIQPRVSVIRTTKGRGNKDRRRR